MTVNACSLTAPKSGSHMIGFAMGLPTKPIWQMSSTHNIRKFRTEDEMIGVLKGWPWKQGIWTHVPHSDRMAEYFRSQFDITLFTRRDPRDIIVSISHYIDRFPASTLNWDYGGMQLSKMGWHQRMFHMIEEYGSQLLEFAPWIHEAGVWQIKYEDCVDDRAKVFDKLRVNLIAEGQNPPTLEKMIEQSLYKHKLSFRRGVYGDWKLELNNKHIDHAKVHMAKAVEAYGYEW